MGEIYLWSINYVRNGPFSLIGDIMTMMMMITRLLKITTSSHKLNDLCYIHVDKKKTKKQSYNAKITSNLV